MRDRPASDLRAQAPRRPPLSSSDLRGGASVLRRVLGRHRDLLDVAPRDELGRHEDPARRPRAGAARRQDLADLVLGLRAADLAAVTRCCSAGLARRPHGSSLSRVHEGLRGGPLVDQGVHAKSIPVSPLPEGAPGPGGLRGLADTWPSSRNGSGESRLVTPPQGDVSRERRPRPPNDRRRDPALAGSRRRARTRSWVPGP